MADDPLNVQHKVILEYEEKIQSTLASHLAGIQKQLDKLDKSSKKHSKQTKSSETATKGAAKSYQKAGKSMGKMTSNMGKMSKVAFGIGKSLGLAGVAAITASKALYAFYRASKLLVESQDIMAKFAAQTGEGSLAVISLKNAYADMTIGADLATVSVRNLVQSMSDFASVGLPQQLLASEQAVQSAVGTLNDTLAQMFDKSTAMDIGKAIFQGGMKDNIPVMMEFIKSINTARESGGDLAQEFENVAMRFRAFDESNLLVMQGAMRELQMQAQGAGDGGVAAFSAWSELTNKLSSLLENLQQTIIDTYGSSLAKLLDTANKKLSKFVVHIKDWGDAIEEWYTIVKVYAHNFAEVFKQMFTKTIAIGAECWATLGEAVGEFLLLVTGGLSETGRALDEWGEETNKKWQKAFDEPPNWLNVEEELEDLQYRREKAQNKLVKLQKDQTAATRKTLTPLQALVVEQTKLRDQLNSDILPYVKSWTKALEDAVSVTSTLGELTALTGSNYKVMGHEIGEFTREIGREQLKMARQLLDESSAENLITAMKLINSIQKEIKQEGTSVEREQKLADALKKQEEILTGQVKAYSTLKQYMKDYTADVEANLRLTEKSRSIAESQLKITQAIYGTPALAVDAQLAIVKTMEQEKSLLMDKLALQKEAMANMSDEDIAAGGLQFAQEAILDIQKQITDKTAEQLNLVKQLRDGYLDAIQAQAFGAGRFSKILITQEKNLMRGLQKGTAKRNYLLGQFGAAAGKAQASALRFSAQGMGQMTIDGQTMTPGGSLRQQEARIAGVDVSQAGPAREAANIVTGIVSSANKNTYELARHYSAQTDRIVSAIGNLASAGSQKAATALGLQGRPGITTAGEAMRQMKGVVGYPQVVPAPIMGPPAPIMGPPAPTVGPVTKTSGTAKTNPIGSNSGNMQSRMKTVTQTLMAMAIQMDDMNKKQNNITAYAGNRTHQIIM